MRNLITFFTLLACLPFAAAPATSQTCQFQNGCLLPQAGGGGRGLH